MGNTMRMRPRDAEGRGVGDDMAPQRSTKQQHAAAWDDAWEVQPRAGGEDQDAQRAKISIKVASTCLDDTDRQQEPSSCLLFCNSLV